MKKRWDSVVEAADLALLGAAAFAAALAVVTAGAAVAAASAAVRDRCTTGSLPPWRTTGSRFSKGILPGLGPTVIAVAVAVLLLIDVRALLAGIVPGGPPVVAATAIVALLLCGLSGLVLIEVGRRDGRAWLASARSALAIAWQRPVRVVLAAAIGVLAVLLALAVPITAPIVLGVYLFALHAWAQV
jgi:hypothetical protein